MATAITVLPASRNRGGNRWNLLYNLFPTRRFAPAAACCGPDGSWRKVGRDNATVVLLRKAPVSVGSDPDGWYLLKPAAFASSVMLADLIHSNIKDITLTSGFVHGGTFLQNVSQ